MVGASIHTTSRPKISEVPPTLQIESYHLKPGLLKTSVQKDSKTPVPHFSLRLSLKRSYPRAEKV